jgi:hypothetical protein
MKSIPQGLPFCLALVIGVGVSVLYSSAGLGASGALIFGALFSTVVFSLVGARMRIWLAAISTVPPFILSSSDNIRGSHYSVLEDAVWYTLPTIAMAFGVLVALPLAIVSSVFYFTYCRHPVSTP